ncbi:MAG: transglutaminase family protein [Opitutales bacterium]|nr:transglutaminase family protein [Opitutales bacterium]
MKLSIHHRTCYTYSAPVSFGDQHVFLRPRDSNVLVVDSFTLETSPPSRQRWVRDAFNNIVLVTNTGLVTATDLVLTCGMTVQSLEANPFDFVLEPYATGYPFDYEERERTALAPAVETAVPEAETVMDWFRSVVPTPDRHEDVVQFLSDLNSAVRASITYERRDEEGIQTPDETLRLRRGSCRDMAMLFIAVCRRLGLAARFVSGYLYDAPPEEAGTGGAGEGVGFNRAVGSMHAWAEVYLPGAGWKGFDPTNGILANAYFVPAAVAIDPSSVSPVQGNYYSAVPVTSTVKVDLDIKLVP